MAGKKGMKMCLNKDQSPRCIEYYVKNFPELSLEECEQKLKTFKRSCNYQCIEFYERKYPELSHEEHLKLRKETINKKKENTPINLEYYIKHFPELSLEECRKKFHQYTAENNYCCIEYYLKRGYTLEEAKIQRDLNVNKAIDKIRPKISGKNNGMHSSKTSQEKRNSISPKRIEFYERKYPELSHEEHLKMLQDQINKTNNSNKINHGYNTTIEYYLDKGLSYEDAYLKLKERQTTFSLQKCIDKYGEEIGHIKFAQRQKKWLNSLYKNFQNNGDGRSKQSKFAKDLIINICKYFEIEIPKKEFYIYDKQNKRAYAYDFHYNYHIIEFNGDFWHCNPNIYNEDFYNKVKQKYAKDIWEYDKIKINLCHNYNLKTLTIWESEYNENKEETLQKCIKFLKDA